MHTYRKKTSLGKAIVALSSEDTAWIFNISLRFVWTV